MLSLRHVCLFLVFNCCLTICGDVGTNVCPGLLWILIVPFVFHVLLFWVKPNAMNLVLRLGVTCFSPGRPIGAARARARSSASASGQCLREETRWPVLRMATVASNKPPAPPTGRRSAVAAAAAAAVVGQGAGAVGRDVRIDVDVPLEAALRLRRLCEEGALARLGVVGVRLDGGNPPSLFPVKSF